MPSTNQGSFITFEELGISPEHGRRLASGQRHDEIRYITDMLEFLVGRVVDIDKRLERLEASSKP